ncbi:hypothetical protein JCGZ_10834 [Jatropha curcas]|uniref:Aminotransferase-like plant mobile domain-containing protein n=1 Tax=Jatropha curcas TaxID=180498 RepID=A0A067KGT6_JATCU|nr:hypothetical protein JCGZ_10834 [Jatropha curcas]
MAVKNVVDWLLGSTVIDPVTRPVSHSMKLREFIPNAGNSISLWHDLPSHVFWGTTEKSVKRGNSVGNTYTTDEWFDRLPIQVQDCVREVSFGHFVDTLPRVQGWTLPSRILAWMERWIDTSHTFHMSFDEMMIKSMDFAAITILLF